MMRDIFLQIYEFDALMFGMSTQPQVTPIYKCITIQGYKLVGIKVIVPSRDLASDHYAEHDGKSFFPKLVNFLSSSAVVAMVRARSE